jgi:hypothetical protein
MTVSANGQTSQETEFAKKIIEVFKAKSFDSFKMLLPTKADFEKLNSDTGMVRGLFADTDEKYKEVLDSYDKKIDSAYESEFNRLLKEGDSLNIDWTQITFLKFTFKKSKPKNSDKIMLSGFINFRYEDSVYRLSVLGAMKINGEYKVNIIRLLSR